MTDTNKSPLDSGDAIATQMVTVSSHFAKQFYCDAKAEYFAGGHAWSDGTLYKFTVNSAEHLLKVMPAADEDAIRAVTERQDYMEYLNQNGVASPKPLHSSSGKLVESFSHAGKLYLAYAWKLVPGNHIAEKDPRLLRDFYTAWGSLLGKTHRLAKLYPTWANSREKDADGIPLISWQREWEHFYNWLPDKELKQAWLRMKQDLEALPVTRHNFGFVHNDAHPMNILVEGSELSLLDFDVANFQWFTLDIAICIYSEYSRVQHHSAFAELKGDMEELFVRPFMQAYESENQLPTSEYKQIELFLLYRKFIMFTVFYDQIKSNAPQYLEIMKASMLNRDTFLPERNYFNSLP